ncbi:MAG TPA: DUF4062 domain-containing protein [Actinomycetota bacterium]|nr:DUF4062 domain-containing protein [Actinomycetota bacterium]
MPTILTPDQRLRVFISSTLGELAAERKAVKTAIEEIHLSPVMFELGARPHPPRTLYRAYLDQSHIFVGIYWQKYGWVAPEMEISGLEDEYLLAAGKLKLIYVKSAEDREPRLSELLDRIRNDDQVSYKSFRDADELRSLVTDDLAILLTESFDAARSETPTTPTRERARTSRLPIQPTDFIGRESEITQIAALLDRDDVKMVTLVGPGGIGKTRIAIEVAQHLEDAFEDGLRFVPLAAFRNADNLPTYLVDALELKENTSDTTAALQHWIAQKDVLLVLDNFEQLLEGAWLIADLLEAAGDSGSKILVTSRAVLRIRGEHEWPIPPMTLPKDVEGSISRSDAIRLFMERARQVQPHFTADGREMAIVAEICRRLDGLPLAIELAAARLKLLTPAQLFERLGNRLELLTGGARDLPERQQTLRATIDWSYGLLRDEEKELFARLSVFRRGATLDAIEVVCAGRADVDVLEALASLVEKSLLRQELAETGEARFWMLETIREYAAELFEDLPDRVAVGDRHAEFYEQLCAKAQYGTIGSEQQEWFTRVELDYPNIRVAADHLLRHGGAARVAKMAWDLVLFTWVHGHMTDARRACETALQDPSLDDRARAYALAAGGSAAFWQGDFGEAIPLIAQAKDLFEKIGDERGRGTTLLVLGMVAPELEGPEEAKARLVEALELFERLGERSWLAIGFTAYTWTLMLMGEYEGREDLYERSVALSREMGGELIEGMSLGNLSQLRSVQGRHDEAIRLQIEGLKPLVAAGHMGAIGYTWLNAAQLLARIGAFDDAARFMGARDALYERMNVLDLSLMEKKRAGVEEFLRAEMGDGAYEDARADGRTMSIEAARGLLTSRVGVSA